MLLLLWVPCLLRADEFPGPSWKTITPILQADPKEVPSAAPDVRAIRVYSDSQYLWILVEGASPDAVAKGVEIGGKAVSFTKTLNRWFLTLSGEQLNDRSWTIDFSDGQPRCSLPEAACRYVPELQATEVRVPLAVLGVGPITLAASAQTLFFVQDGMVGHEASRRLPSRGSVALAIFGLPQLTGNPSIKKLACEPEPGCVAVAFDADRKVAYDITIADMSGKIVGSARNSYPVRRQRAYVVDLPSGRYRATLSLVDSAGRRVAVTSDFFDISQPDPEKQDRFLQVKGKFIVDGAGKQVRLVGMARCQYLDKYEDSLWGGLGAQLAHYRALGINCIRLAVSPMRQGRPGEDLYETLGPERFVDEVIAPDVTAILASGLYVIIDDHHIKTTIEQRDRWIPLWEAIARRYRDEPRVVMYELWNEPNLDPSGLSPASAPAIQDWYRRCIAAIRKVDQRHILLVSDWNAGWGAATESMWASDDFLIDEPYHQVAFSKHLAKEHCNEAFVAQNLDRVADQWNIPLVIGELELEQDLQTSDDLSRFLGIMGKDPRSYSVWLWRPHPDKSIFADIWSPWAKGYASPTPGNDAVKKVTSQ